MILGYDDIMKELRYGDLRFSPGLAEGQVRESSVDLLLGSTFYRWLRRDEVELQPDFTDESRRVRIDRIAGLEGSEALNRIMHQYTVRSELSEEGYFVLQPGAFALVDVSQGVELPPYLAGRIEGRTRFARMGLEVHSTAPTIRAGWQGFIRLELKNMSPSLIFELRPGDGICQLILERVLTPSVVERGATF